MTENTVSTFTFDFPLTFAPASCEIYLPHYTLFYTLPLIFYIWLPRVLQLLLSRSVFRMQSDSFAFSLALLSIFKQTHRAVMWVNIWFMIWKCSIKSFGKRASFMSFAWSSRCAWSHWCVIPSLLTRSQEGQRSFALFFFSQSRSFSTSLYEWNLIGCSDVSEMFH